MHNFTNISFRGNVISAKCKFWLVQILENKFLGKRKFWQEQFFAKRAFEEMKFLASACSRKCYFWQVQIHRNVHLSVVLSKWFLVKFNFWKVFFGEVHDSPKDAFLTYIFEILNKCSFIIANVFTQFPVVLAEIGDSPAKWC